MNSQHNPLVSVVTPVYNGDAYLVECIESVLAQTYSNWEYIILNNCSTDRTLEIAKKYASRDCRIRVHSNDSLLPIIANHNAAFRMISPSSSYCKVVSADDWLVPACLEQMVRLAETYPSVGFVGSYQVSGSGKNWRAWKVRWDEIPYSQVVISGTEMVRQYLLGGPYVFGTPTSLMYRSDLVRAEDEFYPNATAEADTSACVKHLRRTDFGFVHQVLSYERIHEQATSTTCRNLNTYESSKLADLIHYGPLYLTEEELSKRRAEILANYYKFLAVSAIHARENKFWDYHRERLKQLGHPLSRIRLAKAVATKLVDLVLNPKQTAEKILTREVAVE